MASSVGEYKVLVYDNPVWQDPCIVFVDISGRMQAHGMFSAQTTCRRLKESGFAVVPGDASAVESFRKRSEGQYLRPLDDDYRQRLGI